MPAVGGRDLHRHAHLNVDECGAPEAIAGVKLLTVDRGARQADAGSRRTRGSPESATSTRCNRGSSRFRSAPSWGPCTRHRKPASSPIWRTAHGLLVHVDGARLSNAAAALGCSLAALTTDAGVDILSFGGTKNGLLGAEAVVFLDGGAGRWLPVPAQAVAPARFEDALPRRPVRCPADRRAVAALRPAGERDGGPAGRRRRRRAGRRDHASGSDQCRVRAGADGGDSGPPERSSPSTSWDERAGEVRWMCSWDTTEDDVESFVAAVKNVLDAAA